jgi:3-hydroxybutyryl-CoA dehydrogenase
MTTPRSIAIVGAGFMGVGLARIFRDKGWPVAAFDVDAGVLDALVAAVPGTRAASSLRDAVADAEFVIEAVSEKPALKQAIFAEMAACTRAGTVLASNSSVIQVGVITANVPDEHAGRCIGTHFWNPPELIPLVEVIAGPRSADWAIDTAMAVLADAGKEPVRVRADTVPGNRMQHALWREAIALVQEGVCLPEEVDHIVRRSFGLRLAALGPIENADLIGLDLTQQIHDIVFPVTNRSDAANPLLADKIAAGALGAKSGAGFYDGWTDQRTAAVKKRLADHLDEQLG